MKCFVTGASGFVGSNLVHELLEQGHRVKALVRAESNLLGIQGADVELVRGDLGDRPGLTAAMRGCDWCFHVAASYHLWLPDYGPMYAANVEGTRNVLEAANKAGCSRIIYTSTVGCVGLPAVQNGDLTGADESMAVNPRQLNGHYKRSKLQAEVVAYELFNKGIPIVVVNPCAPVGPRDVKPTPTGRVILDFLNHKMPAYLDTGFNLVHVRDVARGHILAAETGRLGERYILGHAEGNWTLKQCLQKVAELTGLPAPRIKLPYPMALAAAYVDEGIAWMSGRPPKVPLAGVQMARNKMFFNPAKAIRELKIPQTPPEEGLRDAVNWFQENGYVTG